MEDKLKLAISMKDWSYKLPTFNQWMALRSDWIPFGDDNMFPDELLYMVNNSSIQKSIIENKLAYMLGAGLEGINDNIYRPNLLMTWDEIVTRCMTDYAYMSAFAIQIILNEDGKHYSFFHQPVTEIRFGQYNKNNFIDTAYLNTDWITSPNNYVKIKMYGSEEIQKGEPYLIYYKKYQSGNYYYAIPNYASAANWMLSDKALSEYYVNFINNNFSSNFAISYPYTPNDEQRKLIYDGISQSFGGKLNAGEIMLLFGEQGNTPKLETISSTNADLYDNFCDQVMKYLVSSNRLTSPMLAGLTTKSGFSNKKDELIAAYTLYKLTVIEPERNFVLKNLNNLLVMNGKKKSLTIADYNVIAELEGQVESNDKKTEEVLNIDRNTETEESKENNQDLKE